MADTDELFAGVVPFVEVARARSFRAAATALGVSPAAVSKAVTRLEARVGVSLLLRTTRSVALTREGALFQARCEEAIASVRAGRDLLEESHTPAGEVRLSVPFILGSLVTRNLGVFLARYPRAQVRVTAADRLVNLSGEGIDCALRIGARGGAARLLARRLRHTRWVTVAAPVYLAQRGVPSSPDELRHHECLVFLPVDGRPRPWTFAGAPELAAVPGGRLVMDQGGQLVEAAVAGLGIAQVLDFMVGELLLSGALVEVLGAVAAAGPDVHLVALKERSRVPVVRALMDHLVTVMDGPRAAQPR